MAAVRKLKPPPRSEIFPATKIFHATMLVTRAEEWWVEAETAAEARRLLASGQGYRAAPGACVHVELEQIREEDSG